MSQRQTAKKRSEMLKDLRNQHADSVSRVQALLKEQKQIHREICQTIRSEAKTIPEIAETIGLPTHETLWHITALKKYDIVIEDGMCGEYYLYKRAEEQ